MPPTKQQINQAGVVVTAEKLNNLLGRNQQKPIIGQKQQLVLNQEPLQKLPETRVNQMSQQNPFSDSQRLVDNTMSDSQKLREQYKQQAQNNINPHQPEQIQQKPNITNKKPSQMTKQELEIYQHETQIKDWKKLIDIMLNREPSTFDKMDHESYMKNPEYRQLYQQAQNKQNGDIKPVVPRDAKERFDPIQQPSMNYNDTMQQQHQQQELIQQQTQYNQQLPQINQQLPQIQQMQYPLQYYQQYYQPANQHILQTIQDLQLELQLTKSQCDRYQGDIIRLERENSQLRQQVQQVKMEKEQIQFKYQQVSNIVNDLRQQIMMVQQTVSQQKFNQQPVQQQNNEFITPLNQEQNTNLYTKQTNKQQTQQLNTSINASQIDINDVDQIMRNAEQLLGKHNDDDDEILENNYKNLLQSQRELKRQVQSESAVTRINENNQQQKQQAVQEIEQQNDYNSSLLPQSKYDRKRH